MGFSLAVELEDLGYDARLDRAIADLGHGLEAARVAAVDRSSVLLLGLGEPALGKPSGRWRHEGMGPLGQPTVGDWAAVRVDRGLAVIEALLPRRSLFFRKSAGRSSAPQPIAANVDVILVVTDVDRDFSPRRLERYASAAIAGGAEPVVVVNKADLPHDPDELSTTIEQVLGQRRCVFVTTRRDDGLVPLLDEMAPRRTYALVGSSGVGKSTILNRMLGEERQSTLDVREADGKGRHTTTRRELVATPTGALVIDTPGMREFGIVDAHEGVAEIFADIEEIAGGCRYRDCTHHGEPGCAVERASAEGIVPAARVQSWIDLQDELALNEQRATESKPSNAKKRWKSINKEARRMRRLHGKLGMKDR